MHATSSTSAPSLSSYTCKFSPLAQYLTKQTAALREVNDSRLRIYEQLEVSIQDLERANHRLALENAADKKHIKSLTGNIEALELRCEELQGTIDDLRIQVDVLRRKTQRSNGEGARRSGGVEVVRLRHVEDYGGDSGGGGRRRTADEHAEDVGFVDYVSLKKISLVLGIFPVHTKIRGEMSTPP